MISSGIVIMLEFDFGERNCRNIPRYSRITKEYCGRSTGRALWKEVLLGNRVPKLSGIAEGLSIPFWEGFSYSVLCISFRTPLTTTIFSKMNTALPGILGKCLVPTGNPFTLLRLAPDGRQFHIFDPDGRDQVRQEDNESSQANISQ